MMIRHGSLSNVWDYPSVATTICICLYILGVVGFMLYYIKISSIVRNARKENDKRLSNDARRASEIKGT